MKSKSQKKRIAAQDFHSRRRMGIGGSDVAGILGFSPWQSPMDVWLSKKGLEAERSRDVNREFLLTLGKELEPVIARCYERETRKILVPSGHVWEHKKYACLIGNPDRFVMDHTRGVELKSENQFQDSFGDPGTAEVPVHYALQCAHYMSVCDVDRWDVAVLHGGARFAIYTLVRDRELEAQINERLVTWWENHILKDVPPDVDSSDAWKIYLKKKFPSELAPSVTADARAETMLRDLAWLREGRATLEEMLSKLETELKLRIGEHAGIHGHWGRVTWKKTKDMNKVDWQAALSRLSPLVPHETMAKILTECTAITPGVRRFLFSPKENYERDQSAAREAFRRFAAEIGVGAIPDGGASRGPDQSALPVRGTSPEGPGPGEAEASPRVQTPDLCGSG